MGSLEPQQPSLRQGFLYLFGYFLALLDDDRAGRVHDHFRLDLIGRPGPQGCGRHVVHGPVGRHELRGDLVDHRRHGLPCGRVHIGYRDQDGAGSNVSLDVEKLLAEDPRVEGLGCQAHHILLDGR